ncbi:MAG: hypothetical protein IAB19_00010 [Proteobacteria bacterium]|uniref:Uncharacterized protein n=1 Tax=Candidatus Avisuccinivibrio stercorigallinarum TaxID=2840704 RepID=A0A9D9DAB4_9GAMM|nr:hypothetical protein [Candidatus Avisuccinivibrio stercorigallinarum]
MSGCVWFSLTFLSVCSGIEYWLARSEISLNAVAGALLCLPALIAAAAALPALVLTRKDGRKAVLLFCFALLMFAGRVCCWLIGAG